MHTGISGVSSSRKYFIKEDQDPGDWDSAWRQVTSGLPRTDSRVGLQSQSTHQTHLCSRGDSGGAKKRGFRSFLAPFRPQISPQLGRNRCLLPEIHRQGGVITHTSAKPGEEK